jgi:hypothetical protein
MGPVPATQNITNSFNFCDLYALAGLEKSFLKVPE